MLLRHTRNTLAVVTTALTLFVGQTAMADTLTDALISAYKNSGLLEQNRALLRAADEDVAAAVAGLRPTFSYFANSNYSRTALAESTTANVGVTVDLLIYDFGVSPLTIDAAKESVLATRDALISVEQSVLLRAVSAFMNVRLAINFVELARSSQRLIGEELQAARDRFEVGEVTRTDVSQAEARLAAARSALAAARGQLVLAREEYRAVVGNYPGRLTAPPNAPAIPSSLAAASDVAQKGHPDLSQAKRNVTISELNVLRANANRRPSISASGQLSFDDDGDRSDSIGVTLSGPIYTGGGLASAERRAIAVRDATRAALLITSVSINQQIGNAWSTNVVARASVAAGRSQVVAARQAFEGTREEANLGARTTLDVLDAQQEQLDAEANLASSRVDEYIAIYGILSAMGLLTVDHLNLGLQTYDPANYYNAVKRAPAEISAQGRALERVLRGIGKN